ncbi:MAG: TlpA family protein disulfide reductase [Planctomycetota bacterium]|jgi:thiol-disulfide isomerase/thioredoxin
METVHSMPRALTGRVAVALLAGAVAVAACATRPEPEARGPAEAAPAASPDAADAAPDAAAFAKTADSGSAASEGAASAEPCTGDQVVAKAVPAAPAAPADQDAEGPCEEPGVVPGAAVPVPAPGDASASPFADGFKSPKRLWAHSFQWAKAPELEVETWLTDEPDTKGKYVLIEFWNTWCPPCRRSLKLLNRLHERFGSELAVIAVCDEAPEVVRNFKTHKVECYSAIDTQARTKKEVGVWGVPHAILLEPEGFVVWEGFPLQKGYELTEELVDKVLAVGRRQKAKRAAP